MVFCLDSCSMASMVSYFQWHRKSVRDPIVLPIISTLRRSHYKSLHETCP